MHLLGREAPTIAEASSARRRTQASAELGHRQPGLVGDRAQPLDRLEDLVAHVALDREAHLVAGGARVGGGSSPGWYLPVSTPWASGDQTICEIPFAAQSGNTSASGARQIALYCGCEETSFAAPATSSAAPICSGSTR